ncbi:hypothetical protein NC980_08285, partial [Leptolyngbya sp. AS-A5]
QKSSSRLDMRANWAGFLAISAYRVCPFLVPFLIPNSGYATFEIAPNTGRSMNFNTLSFDGRRSPTGSQLVQVRSSRDNYAAVLATFSLPVSDVFYPLSLAFTGTDFQNLTTSVSFRIYGYNATAGAGTLRFDNVVLDGTTQAATPVPFGFTPIWGIAANGVVFGLRKLRNKQMRSGSQSSVKA